MATGLGDLGVGEVRGRGWGAQRVLLLHRAALPRIQAACTAKACACGVSESGSRPQHSPSPLFVLARGGVTEGFRALGWRHRVQGIKEGFRAR